MESPNIREMKVTNKFLFGCVLTIIATLSINAQEVSIKVGKNEIALNQYFTITIEVKNDRLKKYDGFPEIEGFIKRGTSSSSTTNFVNGRMSSTQSLTQNYQATEKGSFRLAPFTININGKDASSNGTTITVTEAVQRQARRRRDPFEDFFGRRSSEPTEFVEVEADAFLALSTDKSEVYVGEGFTATLAFYVAESNTADMRFFDLSNQISEIIKVLKPGNCWEENFSIEQIIGEPVTIGKRNYTQFKVYQTAYFPLTVEDITFPSTGLKMIKYNVAKNPSFFGRNRQEDYQTFYSKEKVVKVNELPAHPLKESVAVGNYRLDERISTKELETGQSFDYTFNIRGEGNITALEAPMPLKTESFDIYEPNVRQNVNRAQGRVSGTKGYDYYAIPNEPGTYHLGDYFSWVFFNTRTDQYDTLKSNITVNVSGASRKNLSIASNDLGNFYDQILNADNELKSIHESPWLAYLVNIFIVLVVAATGYLILRKTAS